MLNHIGTNDIKTERLLLRKFRLEDAEEMFENWAKDPENVKFLEWNAHKDANETRSIIKMWNEEYKSKKTYNWCITINDTNEIIGNITVVKFFEDIDCAEIGYVISKKHWNKGIMTEALGGVIKYLFCKVGVNRIQLKHDVDNLASGKVMIKNGLKKEGFLREAYRNNKGRLRDMAIYSILKSEFKEDF